MAVGLRLETAIATRDTVIIYPSTPNGSSAGVCGLSGAMTLACNTRGGSVLVQFVVLDQTVNARTKASSPIETAKAFKILGFWANCDGGVLGQILDFAGYFVFICRTLQDVVRWALLTKNLNKGCNVFTSQPSVYGTAIQSC